MKKLWFCFLVSFLIIIIILLLILGIGYVVKSEKIGADISANSFVVVLDCGHGGIDGGADGTPEKDINLSLGFKLKEILESNGYHVVMTREKDDFICDDHSASIREQNVSDLHNRLKIAEDYPNSVFISLHMNKYSESKYWGSQIFYGPKNANSKLFAEYIQKSLITKIQKGNTRQIKEMDSSVYIIYNATNPAILLEYGFMSNEEELKNFKSEEYQSKFAYSVYLGIDNYLKGRKV